MCTKAQDTDAQCVMNFYTSYYRGLGVSNSADIAIGLETFLTSPLSTQVYDYLVSREELLICSSNAGELCETQKASLIAKQLAVKDFLQFIETSKQNEEAMKIISQAALSAQISDLADHVLNGLEARYCSVAGLMKAKEYDL